MSTTLESLSNDLAAAVDRAGTSVVAIHARRRIPASGIVWRPGVIVAADHTVHKDDDVRVTLADGSDVRATVAGRDPSTDLCVLRVPDAATPAPATVARTPLRVGQLVLALGRPGTAVTASLGIVSAVGPEWRTWRGGRVDQFVRLDLAIYDGFSGGPLVDAAGQVLGLGTSGLARAAAVAVPAATVDRVADQLLAGGRIKPGFLGIGTQPVRLTDALRGRLAPIGGHVPEAGLMIVAVEPGAPADRAGLLLGDLLVALDDQPTADPRDVLAALGPDTVGRVLQATVLRGGEPATVAITVGEHPSRS
ncbi:MAG: serine protease [Gemmatirosa sp.]|nr:serine protease [Gemmatirosa sp.]